MSKRIAVVLMSAAWLTGAAERLQLPVEPIWTLQPKIVFTSTRENTAVNPLLAGEIYMMNPDLTGEEQITSVDNASNSFAVLSATGKRMVFESNRLRGTGRLNTADLFLMDLDVRDERHLIRGSSATWSPDGHRFAYHASASGTGLPINGDPGAATADSDIFVLSVDEFLEGGEAPVNITNTPDEIDEDADWSPDGLTIAFTRHGVNDPHNNATTREIYTMNADGSGLTQLTSNSVDERGPDWSPDGSRIVYACRKGELLPSGVPTFEICIMNADGSNQVQLTFNGTADLTPSWSLDGTQIVFHRNIGAGAQLFRMNPDGTGDTQITNAPGFNVLASQGVARVDSLPGSGGGPLLLWTLPERLLARLYRQR